MSNFDENVIAKLKRLEREVERLKVGEKANNDGWIPVSSTWTYASATTINVPSGAAAIYTIGDKWKLTANGVVLQGYVNNVADTLLTVAGDALTNHTFSACYYSHEESPVGYDGGHTFVGPVTIDDSVVGKWQAWTPTFTGWAAGSPTCVARYAVVGKMCFFSISLSAGTSNATGASATLPIRALNAGTHYWGGANMSAVNNGVTLTGASRWWIPSNGGSVNWNTDMAGAAWTNSGTKRVETTGFYEI